MKSFCSWMIGANMEIVSSPAMGLILHRISQYFVQCIACESRPLSMGTKPIYSLKIEVIESHTPLDNRKIEIVDIIVLCRPYFVSLVVISSVISSWRKWRQGGRGSFDHIGDLKCISSRDVHDYENWFPWVPFTEIVWLILEYGLIISYDISYGI